SSSQAQVSASDQSNLISRITNAVRPCYNLGSLSGTSAEDIVVRLRIQPSRDGSLSSRQVSVLGAQGVNGSNREYQRQMVEAARSAVLNPRCPLPSLPDSMYENGWSDVVLRFIPAQLT
ncbi:MAG: cell envelope integrity protein TolA, partial [Sphingomonadaceae bacterium]|nr:cell envelope integrity protein TolA [Sphingomonadaceae bacterium]